MMTGYYVGIRARLRGKTALLKEGPGGYYAQFDDLRLPESHGWHWFPRTAFHAIHHGEMP